MSNSRKVKEIDAAMPYVCDDDEQKKLAYVRKQITPEGLAKRSEDDQNVSHLIAVADGIIHRYVPGGTNV